MWPQLKLHPHSKIWRVIVIQQNALGSFIGLQFNINWFSSCLYQKNIVISYWYQIPIGTGYFEDMDMHLKPQNVTNSLRRLGIFWASIAQNNLKMLLPLIFIDLHQEMWGWTFSSVATWRGEN